MKTRSRIAVHERGSGPARPLPPRILLYEQNADLAELVTNMLEERGYAVLGASSLAQAEGMIANGEASLFLLGTGARTPCTPLPEAQRRGIPVVLFTTWNVDRAEAQGAGYADVIIKPFDLGDMLDRIAAQLPRP